MKSQRNRGGRSSTGRLVSATLLLLLPSGCVDLLDQQSNCRVDYNDLASDPYYGFRVEHNSPRQCPVGIGRSGQGTEYSAVVRLYHDRAQSNLNLQIVNQLGLNAGSGSFQFDNDPANPGTHVRANPGGIYSAGTVVPDFGDMRTFQDIANNSVRVTGGTAVGQVYLPYRLAALASLYPETGVAIGDSYTQGVSVNAELSPAYPLTYDWYQDGSPLGVNAASVTTTFPTLGDHTLEAVVTDANGKVERWKTVVPVHNVGGCDLEPCDPPA